MTATSLTTQVSLWRRLLAGAAGILGGIVLAVEVGDVRKAALLAIPVGGPALAALIVHRPSLGPQLLARAIWWSNLGLGAILCITGNGERDLGIVMTLGCGAALLIIGRKGLAEAIERAAFVPAAFRSSLLLLMVLALADAQTLGFFAILDYDRRSEAAVPLALGALAFTVGFIGLYRLAVWGALVNVAAAVTLFAVAAGGTVHLDHDLDTIVPVLTGVHILAAAPMLVAMVLGKPLPALRPRARAILVPAAIVFVMAMSIFIALAHHELRHIFLSPY